MNYQILKTNNMKTLISKIKSLTVVEVAMLVIACPITVSFGVLVYALILDGSTATI